MRKRNVIVRKEWKNFLGSERGVFVIYAVLVLFWSFLPLNKDLGNGPIWWLFFSVIISGNFSNTVFVSERLSGSMEILLTCGFSRDAVLFGKVAFVLLMSIAIGAACFSLSLVWLLLASGLSHVSVSSETLSSAALFVAGALMNVSCGAWLSIRLQSPRIIPFMTIIILALVVSGFSGLASVCHAPQWILGLVLAAAGGVFLFFAKKEFHGEKVIAPIHL